MNLYLGLACVVGACTGLVFGYDLGVAGGVASMPDFQKLFFQQVYQRTEQQGSPYCKLCMGLGIGLVVQSGPLFLAELAPAHLRGRFGFMFQLFVTCGLLLAQVVNYLVRDLEVGWRISLGLECVPALLLVVGSLLGPDTPASLAQRGRMACCEATLQKLRGTRDVWQELTELLGASSGQSTASACRLLLTARALVPQLVLTVFLAAANQLNMINGVVFFMPQLMQSLGGGRGMSLLMSVVVGGVNVAATVAAVHAVDKLGRRTLLLWTTALAMSCLATAGALLLMFLDTTSGSMPPGATAGFVAVTCLFIVSHAFGIGPLAWLMCSELHPLQTRAAGAGLGVVVNFAFSFFIGQVFLTMLCALRAGVFFMFAGIQALVLVVHYFLVPETKGVPLDQVQGLFAAHKVWRKYAVADATVDRC
ncbi:hypothetical protein OEZ85_011059 [Tetradesmus obliquus]|uniref:Major facilitator superfamily (MFS) profile domain-containing protein n=1 Tax=Tetradesmus obliquus TaxID=3088 RepID=A0ABY8TTT4_TETOB|nr:hypothetical protein OEZ85_011059 [Tetradesmus obliquus]